MLYGACHQNAPEFLSSQCSMTMSSQCSMALLITILEHCADKGHGALWWYGHRTLWWQEFWSIVMTRAMEHCDDTVWNIVMTRIREHCDDKGHGALWWHDHGTLWWDEFWSIVIKGHGALWLKVTRSIVMIWAENSGMTLVMEYCDKNCHGTLCWQEIGRASCRERV